MKLESHPLRIVMFLEQSGLRTVCMQRGANAEIVVHDAHFIDCSLTEDNLIATVRESSLSQFCKQQSVEPLYALLAVDRTFLREHYACIPSGEDLEAHKNQWHDSARELCRTALLTVTDIQRLFLYVAVMQRTLLFRLMLAAHMLSLNLVLVTTYAHALLRTYACSHVSLPAKALSAQLLHACDYDITKVCAWSMTDHCLKMPAHVALSNTLSALLVGLFCMTEERYGRE